MVQKPNNPAPTTAPNATEAQAPTQQAKGAEHLEAKNAEQAEIAALKARIAELEALQRTIAPIGTVAAAAPYPSGTKLVKIETLMPIALAGGRIIAPGQVVEVSEEEAVEFSRVLKGHFSFAGERGKGSAAERHVFQRAKRVA